MSANNFFFKQMIFYLVYLAACNPRTLAINSTIGQSGVIVDRANAAADGNDAILVDIGLFDALQQPLSQMPVVVYTDNCQLTSNTGLTNSDGFFQTTAFASSANQCQISAAVQIEDAAIALNVSAEVFFYPPSIEGGIAIGQPLNIQLTLPFNGNSIYLNSNVLVNFYTSDPYASLPGSLLLTADSGGFLSLPASISFQTPGQHLLWIQDINSKKILAIEHFIINVPNTTSPTNLGNTTVTSDLHKILLAFETNEAISSNKENIHLAFLDTVGQLLPSYSGNITFCSIDDRTNILQTPMVQKVSTALTLEDVIQINTIGNQQLFASDGLILSNSDSIHISSNLLSQIQLSGFSQALLASDYNICLIPEDSSLNPLLQLNIPVKLLASVGNCLPTFNLLVDGNHSLPICISQACRFLQTGQQHIQALVANHVVGQLNVTVIEGAAKSIAIQLPAENIAAQCFQANIFIYNQIGDLCISYHGFIFFSSSDPTAVLPNFVSITAGKGKLQVNDLILYRAGQQTISIYDSYGNTATANSLVHPNQATTGILLGIPNVINSNQLLSATLLVQDSYGNTSDSFTGSYQLTSSDSAAVLPNANWLTIQTGDSLFFNNTLSFMTPGNQTLHLLFPNDSNISGANLVLKVHRLNQLSNRLANHSCVIIDDGNVKCFGNQLNGALGSGLVTFSGSGNNQMGPNLATIHLGSGRSAKQITTGAEHSCAILDNNQVKCWGLNASGQLGLGDTINRGLTTASMADNLPYVALPSNRSAKAITAGNNHTCVILDNNAIACWGANESGELGYGDSFSRGDSPNTMATFLPTVDLGIKHSISGNVNHSAQAIVAGGSHTCALLDDTTVKCWGYNNSGQLGYGDSNNRGVSSNQMGPFLGNIALPAGKNPRQLTAGQFHTCLLYADQHAQCWGSNGRGQLGLGDSNNRADKPNNGMLFFPSIDVGSQGNIVSIRAGDLHTCVLLDTRQMKCFGDNTYGQLGLGDNFPRGVFPQQMGDYLNFVDLGETSIINTVEAGANHTCAWTFDSFLKCWGYNGMGQLGLGDTATRGQLLREMAETLPDVDLW